MLKNYLIKYEAIIGRTEEEGADMAPMELTFYTVVQAADATDAAELVLQHADRGFKTKAVNITALCPDFSADDLSELIAQNKILKVMY